MEILHDIPVELSATSLTLQHPPVAIVTHLAELLTSYNTFTKAKDGTLTILDLFDSCNPKDSKSTIAFLRRVFGGQ